MKALTLHQPWADLIALGIKARETRSWPTSYRGLLAIHAGKTKPDRNNYSDLFHAAGWAFEHLRDVAYRPDGSPVFGMGQLGAIIAVCRVGDCVRTEYVTNPDPFGNYEPGRFAWYLDDIRRVEPIPCRGFQQLWDVPADIARRLEASEAAA